MHSLPFTWRGQLPLKIASLTPYKAITEQKDPAFVPPKDSITPNKIRAVQLNQRGSIDFCHLIKHLPELQTLKHLPELQALKHLPELQALLSLLPSKHDMAVLTDDLKVTC